MLSRGIESGSADVIESAIKVRPLRLAQDRFSVTFRGIQLDFFPTAFGRFESNLVRFSGGLRVKHWRDLRFIKAAKEKR